MTHDEADIITACLQVLAAIIRSNIFAVFPALKKGGSQRCYQHREPQDKTLHDHDRALARAIPPPRTRRA